MLTAVLASLTLAAVSTFGDFVWAFFGLRHRMWYGLVHGAAICLCIGGFVGARAGRTATGLALGPVVGVLAAGAFYVLAPWLRYGAMFPAWMLFWICFGLMLAWLSRERSYGPALLRSVGAAVLSGVAFYLVSGMWTDPPRGGLSYARIFFNWTVAFLPGFLVLFTGGGRSDTITRRW